AEIAATQRDFQTLQKKAAQAESERLAQVARDRINNGHLTDPANDSAAYYLTQLQTSDPTNTAFAAISHDLAGKLLDRARTEAAAGKTAQIDTDLTAARHWGADPKDVAQIQAVAQSLVSKQVTGGAARSSTGSATNPSSAQLAASLKRTKYTEPEYP